MLHNKLNKRGCLPAYQQNSDTATSHPEVVYSLGGDINPMDRSPHKHVMQKAMQVGPVAFKLDIDTLAPCNQVISFHQQSCFASFI